MDDYSAYFNQNRENVMFHKGGKRIKIDGDQDCLFFDFKDQKYKTRRCYNDDRDMYGMCRYPSPESESFLYKK